MNRPALIAACLALQDRTWSSPLPHWQCSRAFWLCERALVTLGARDPSHTIDMRIMRATREIERAK